MASPKQRPLSAQAERARENARQGNGEFGTQHLDRTQVIVPPSVGANCEDLRARMAETEPENIDTFPGEEGLRFTTEEANELLAGHYDDTYLDVERRIQDRREENIRQIASDWCRDAGYEFDDLDEEAQEEAMNMVWSHDNADVVAAIGRTDGDRTMRIRLDSAQAMELLAGKNIADGDDPQARQNRVEAVSASLSRRGIDCSDPQNRVQIEQMVDNGPHEWHHGVSLDVVAEGKVVDYMCDGGIGSRLSYQFDGATVALVDRFDSKVSAVTLSGPLSATVGEMREFGLGSKAPCIDAGLASAAVDDAHPRSVQRHTIRPNRSSRMAAAQALARHPDLPQNIDIALGFGSDDPEVREHAAAATLERAAQLPADEVPHDTAWTLQAINPHLSQERATQVADMVADRQRRKSGHPLSRFSDDEVVESFRRRHGVDPASVDNAWDREVEAMVAECATVVDG